MGLDMYLKKASKINVGMNILYANQILEDEAIDELSEKYRVYVEREDNIRPVPAAIKQVGTKFTAKERMYKPSDVLNAYRPDINVEDVIDFDIDINDGNCLVHFYLKEGSIELSIPEKDYEKFVVVKESPGWICDSEEVCYWRKANQVRQWFVNNLEEPVENCESSTVTKENLEKLISDCECVLNNRGKAKELMPTSSGFFFGSTDYDDYYYNEIERTLINIKQVLKDMDWESETLYYTEWW